MHNKLPAIFETHDGSHTLLAPQFDNVTYHSKFGAIQESQHVFIENGFRLKSIIQTNIAVLEIGLGTALNTLLTIIESAKRPVTVNYVGVENYPINLQIAAQLNYCNLLGLPQLQQIFFDIHQAADNEILTLTPHFTFTKHIALFQQISFSDLFDIIYFDAFAPTTQPELWTTNVFQKMFTALKQDGVLVTYCAKGEVKRALKSVGFHVKAVQGPPGKREMIQAFK